MAKTFEQQRAELQSKLEELQKKEAAKLQKSRLKFIENLSAVADTSLKSSNFNFDDIDVKMLRQAVENMFIELSKSLNKTAKPVKEKRQKAATKDGTSEPASA